MAKLDAPINEADAPKSDRNFDPLPAGWYRATITGAELKDTKNSTKAAPANYIKTEYTIVGPTHQGRKVFGNFNMKNPNPEAERIGRQQLGECQRAIGLPRIEDTDQLIGKTCDIKLSVKPAQGDYDASNDVKAWKAPEGGSLPGPTPSTTPNKGNAGSGGSKPPWAK